MNDHTQCCSLEPDGRQPDVRQPHSRQPHSRQPHSRQPHSRQPHSRQPHSRQPHSRQLNIVKPNRFGQVHEATVRRPRILSVLPRTLDFAEACGCRPVNCGRVAGLLVAVCLLAGWWLLGSIAQAWAEPPQSDADAAWFRESVEPLLRRRCFACHSHEAGKIRGGLTLDARSGWLAGGESGPAIVPGRPDESLLIQAVRHASLEMPPSGKLPDAEIAVLEAWVRRGAPDPRVLAAAAKPLADTRWWSLVPLVRPAIPPLPAVAENAPRFDGRARNPIDVFVAERLQRVGLTFGPPAGRRQLLRRLYFDLLGFPPSPETVAEFLADEAPDAVDRWIDRLLASPRLGERWARHWFDTIHFAESHGYEHDIGRPNAWPYRDYVIEAFNRDTPWPRFIREQLAADIFYPHDTRLTPALGFLGAGTFDLSTFSTAPVTFDYQDRDDQVTQTMAAFASLTANCARCHDHKFDPVSQEDYYALQAVFAGVSKGNLAFDADPRMGEQRRRWTALRGSAEARDASVLLDASWNDSIAAWEQANSGSAAAWHPLEVVAAESRQGSTLSITAPNIVAASGPRPERDVYSLRVRATSPASAGLSADPKSSADPKAADGPPTMPAITAVRLELLADPALPKGGPGRQDNGNLHLNQIELFVQPAGLQPAGTPPAGTPPNSAQPNSAQPAKPTLLKIRRATADFNQAGWTVEQAIDGNAGTAWGIYPQVGQSHVGVFELAEPLVLDANHELLVVLHQTHGGGHLIGRLALAATTATGASARMLASDLAEALRTPAAARSEPQRIAIAAAALRERAEAELNALPPQQQVYAAAMEVERDNRPARLAEPKRVHLLARGDIAKPGVEVPPGAIAALTHAPSRFTLVDTRREGERRAALADWLAHPSNPLSWRSIANRLWHYHWERGLCDTPSDLGRMGSTPTHPELLDWLAAALRDGDGTLKPLHRLIVSSHVYQQASEATHGAAVDPRNAWLWRGPRRRLDADMLRDAVLAVSGRVDWRMGGPSVQQFRSGPGPQLTPKLDYDAYDWNGPDAGRRSVYRFVWRGIADPFMETLDFPDAALLQPARSESVSALQALATLNNDFMLRHSEHFAQRLERDEGVAFDPTGDGIERRRARRAAQLAWQREPTDGELGALTSYASQHGWSALCRVLLNSAEFLYVE